jgi:hypothetical protein
VARFTAPSNATTRGTVKVGLQKAIRSISFEVVEPTNADHTVITSTTGQPIATNIAGAWMHLNVFLDPTNVSFCRVQILEEGQDVSAITGHFTNHPPPAHDSPHLVNTWQPVGYNNLVGNGFHNCSMWGAVNLPAPWTPSGTFKWEVPAKWKVGSGSTNPMTAWHQDFAIDANGTMTIQKFGQSVSRTTNNVIVPRL